MIAVSVSWLFMSQNNCCAVGAAEHNTFWELEPSYWQLLCICNSPLCSLQFLAPTCSTHLWLNCALITWCSLLSVLKLNDRLKDNLSNLTAEWIQVLFILWSQPSSVSFVFDSMLACVLLGFIEVNVHYFLLLLFSLECFKANQVL